MDVLKIFKIIVEIYGSTYKPVVKKYEHFVVAKNEQDARDSYDAEITGCIGSCCTILSCEYIGDVAHLITEETKKHWHKPM